MVPTRAELEQIGTRRLAGWVTWRVSRAGRIHPSTDGSVRQALEHQAGESERRGSGWGPRWADTTWPLRGADGRVAVTFISHLEAGSGFTGGLVRPGE